MLQLCTATKGIIDWLGRVWNKKGQHAKGNEMNEGAEEGVLLVAEAGGFFHGVGELGLETVSSKIRGEGRSKRWSAPPRDLPARRQRLTSPNSGTAADQSD